MATYYMHIHGSFLKVMPPVLLFWLTASKVDGGGMAAEFDPSCQ